MRRGLNFLRRKIAALGEQLWADEQRIARERGEALIRRIAFSDGAERKHLPDPLPSLSQPFREAVSLRAEVADSKRPGKRCGMKKNPARPRKIHGQSSCETSRPVRRVPLRAGIFLLYVAPQKL